MLDYNLPTYDDYKSCIRDRRNENDSWEDIMFVGQSSDEDLQSFLTFCEKYHKWPHINMDEWRGLVNYLRNEEVASVPIDESIWAIGKEQDNNISRVPGAQRSSWQRYKNHLLNKKHFDKNIVEEMERATFRIMRRLRVNLTDGPVKGLVVGNVQSGKTANMAALMAMAADWGWNFFIILSGTIESLRKQTQNRLFTDLNQKDCNINWIVKEKEDLSPHSLDAHKRPSALDLRGNNRYFTVYLKNSVNLQNLIQWLQEDHAVQKNLKVMVIDDEADQAGINTADISEDERSTINQLIINLVQGSFASMNYIGYTATPYANVLNEFGDDTLYPKDFLSILKGSKEYFGPQQIFGNSEAGYDGLDIVREITTADNEAIKRIHNGEKKELPDSFKNALLWFLCGVACRRHWGDKTPVSMLIHTHHKTDQHQEVADAVQKWLTETPKETIISDCNNLYEKEQLRFKKNDLLRDYFDYSGDRDGIKELPSWDDIKSELDCLLESVSPIVIEDNGEITYHRGIHLCIDNSRHNAINNNQIVRLIYPRHELDFASAFIVVGGATLSRGLTLEGLISTYFLRTTKTCDTLMQMGRWFGYRRGYELLPRIWMTKDTQYKFEYLSDLDYDLRMEIHRMAANGISPSECGPKIKKTPNMLQIAAANKTQASVETDFDFSGNHKETTIFDCDKATLDSNIKTTRDFLSELGEPEPRKVCNKHSKNSRIWRKVSNDKVMNFLSKYKYSSRQRFFNDIQSFVDWMNSITEDGQMGPWNVVLAGIADDRNGIWQVGDMYINKVTRTPLADQAERDVINVKRLLDPNDALLDVDLENADSNLKGNFNEYQSSHSPEKVNIIREGNGLGRTPRLMLYVINKNSKANSKRRVDMNAPEDLIGIDILIPGTKSESSARRITIQIPQELRTDNTEDED